MTKEQIQEFTRRTTQENHSGLILVLCDIVRTYTNDALTAYAAGDSDGYMTNVEAARRAHNELMDCFDAANYHGRKVLSVLRYIYGQYVISAIKREPIDLDRCMEMLDSLRVSFEHLHSIDPEGPVMKNTHQVYAGLTYGKGMLNESTLCSDYSNRGYQI